MGSTSTENYSGNRTFIATDPTAFDAGDPILVEPGATPNTVIPLSGTVANRIGVYNTKLQAGAGDNGEINVRLLNAGGTVRVKTSGPINYKQHALAASGGTVTGGVLGVTSIGQYLGPDVASGAIIEVVLAHAV